VDSTEVMKQTAQQAEPNHLLQRTGHAMDGFSGLSIGVVVRAVAPQPTEAGKKRIRDGGK